MKAEERRLRGGRFAAPLFALAALVVPGPASAGDGAPSLAFPVDCITGQSCWLYQYVDVDPGPSAKDYTCGTRSYDGHKGTDIALADLRAMRRGVEVLAAAAGVVRNIRDGVPDRLLDEDARSEVEGRECGNGVAIRHAADWETMYCHMRNGSIRVKPGQFVEQGQPLGLVGLSGNTQFPHLHFGVRHRDEIVDPFSGSPASEGCAAEGAGLWQESATAAMVYSPVDIYQVGASDDVPDPQAAYAGDLNEARLPDTAPVLVAWTTLAAVRAGDRLTLRFLSPDGDVVAESRSVLDDDKVRYFAYAGRRRSGERWEPGRYRIEVNLLRAEGQARVERTASRIITVR